MNSEFNGQLTNREVEKNVAIHDTRKRKNLGLLSKSVSFDNASSVKLNGKCSEVIAANDSAYTPVSNPLKVLACMKLLSSLYLTHKHMISIFLFHHLLIILI